MHGVLVLGALLLAQGTITCLRIREFQVPAHVAEGSEAILGCQFDLQGQRLYAVRWLKNDDVFYHIKPGSTSTPHYFPVRGITVDRARSDQNRVTLMYLSSESAGEYACEVIGQGPNYRTVVAKKTLTIDILPAGDPKVVGVPMIHNMQQPLKLNCTSSGALPISSVTWYINGAPAPLYHLRGPWHTRSASKLGAMDTTMELAFSLQSSHFIDGVMTLKCRATLPPLYDKEVEIRYLVYPQTRQAIHVETSTPLNIKTTEPPFTSTTRQFPIQVEASTPWQVLVTEPPKASQHANRAGLARNFADMLILCVPLVALLK